MNKRILGGLAAAAVLAGGLAVTTTGTASAEVDQETGNVCYETEQFQEFKYKRTVTTPAVEEVVEYRWDIETREPIIQEKIEKETRTRNYVEGEKGQHYSWTGGRLSVDSPPTVVPPNSNWQANTHHEPHESATWVNASLHYTANSQGFASWFYFTPGTDGYWGEWGPWTDSPNAVPVWDDGRDRGPAAHGSGDGWQRQYRYVVVDTRVTGYTAWTPAGSTDWGTSSTPPADTDTVRYVNEQSRVAVEGSPEATETFYYTGEGDGSTKKGDAIWTEEPSIEGWTQFEDRDSERQVEVDCPTKDDEITYGDWTGEPECDETTYIETRTVTTISYTWDESIKDFVASEPVVTTETRRVPVEEFEPCPPTPTTTTQPPTPEPPTSTTTTQPPTVAPTTSEVAQNPPAQVPTTSAATPTAATTTAATTPATGLPATGSDTTGTAALIALLITSLGGAAVLFARRRNVTS